MAVFKKYNLGFGVMVFFTVVTITIFTALLSKSLLTFIPETLVFCQQFLSNTLFKIPQNFSNFLILAVFFMLAMGLLSFMIQLLKTHLFLKRLLIKKLKIPRKFRKTLISLNMSGKVILIKDQNLFSFCSGIFSSRIIITTGLILSLTEKELEAVLLHEQAHLDNLDSLKILLGKTISSMFFFLPIFSDLHQNMIAGSELLADKFTLEKQQEGQFLKSAIKKILIHPQVNLNLVPAVANPDYLEIRIRRLVDPSIKIKLYVSPTSIITSLLFVMFSWFLLQTPVQAFQSKHMNEQPSQNCSHSTKNSVVENPNNLYGPNTNLKYIKNYSSPY